MKNKKDTLNRRSFIKASGIALTATLTSPLMSTAAGFKNELLQAWSCGGLAEAFIPASREYELKTGCPHIYDFDAQMEIRDKSVLNQKA